jgi:hypothetical protein
MSIQLMVEKIITLVFYSFLLLSDAMDEQALQNQLRELNQLKLMAIQVEE